MAPKTNSLCTSSLKGEAQSSPPSRSPSISRSDRAGKATPSIQSASPNSSQSPPIPPRASRPATVRHSLLPDDGRSIDFLKHELVSEGSRRTQIPPTKKELRQGTSVRRSASCSAATRKPMSPAKIQRWAGLTRSVGDWDGLRRVCRSL